MKIAAAIVVMVIALLTQPVAAYPLPVAKPEEVGMSSQGLERIGQTGDRMMYDSLRPT